MKRLPKYCEHKGNGQAYVKLHGVVHYLGAYDTPSSRDEYDRIISGWTANGRRRIDAVATATVNELLLAFVRHAKQHYRDADGQHTSSVASFQPVIRALKQ